MSYYSYHSAYRALTKRRESASGKTPTTYVDLDTMSSSMMNSAGLQDDDEILKRAYELSMQTFNEEQRNRRVERVAAGQLPTLEEYTTMSVDDRTALISGLTEPVAGAGSRVVIPSGLSDREKYEFLRLHAANNMRDRRGPAGGPSRTVPSVPTTASAAAAAAVTATSSVPPPATSAAIRRPGPPAAVPLPVVVDDNDEDGQIALAMQLSLQEAEREKRERKERERERQEREREHQERERERDREERARSSFQPRSTSSSNEMFRPRFGHRSGSSGSRERPGAGAGSAAEVYRLDDRDSAAAAASDSNDGDDFRPRFSSGARHGPATSGTAGVYDDHGEHGVDYEDDEIRKAIARSLDPKEQETEEDRQLREALERSNRESLDARLQALKKKKPERIPGTYRPIVIDGNNVAYEHGNHERFSSDGLLLAYEYFRDFGFQHIHIICKLTRRIEGTDLETCLKLKKEKLLSWATPGRHYDDL